MLADSNKLAFNAAQAKWSQCKREGGCICGPTLSAVECVMLHVGRLSTYKECVDTYGHRLNRSKSLCVQLMQSIVSGYRLHVGFMLPKRDVLVVCGSRNNLTTCTSVHFPLDSTNTSLPLVDIGYYTRT